MSLIEMQRVISRLVTDDQFMASFVSDPRSTCTSFDLQPAEFDSSIENDKI